MRFLRRIKRSFALVVAICAATFTFTVHCQVTIAQSAATPVQSATSAQSQKLARSATPLPATAIADIDEARSTSSVEIHNETERPLVTHPIIQATFLSPLERRRFFRSKDRANEQAENHRPHSKATRLPLKEKLEYCLLLYGTRKLEPIEDRSPWGIMHVAISLGQLAKASYQGRQVNAIEWLLNNGQCRDKRLMYVDKSGNLQTKAGPGFEGHEGQLLAILAQCSVKPDTKIVVEGKSFTVVDLVRKEMLSCRAETELTFKLIGLSYYLDSNGSWNSDDDEPWDIQRLIAEEIKQPINGVACGGTHRLMGLAFSCQRRKLQKQPIDGEWARAQQFIEDYKEYTYSLQNPDGSFSTRWFEGREILDNPQRRLQTSGHILEWMIFASSVEELKQRRMVAAVNYLTNLMLSESETKWAVGPKGHAIRALDLYYRRVFNGEDSIPTARFGDPRLLR